MESAIVIPVNTLIHNNRKNKQLISTQSKTTPQDAMSSYNENDGQQSEM